MRYSTVFSIHMYISRHVLDLATCTHNVISSLESRAGRVINALHVYLLRQLQFLIPPEYEVFCKPLARIRHISSLQGVRLYLHPMILLRYCNFHNKCMIFAKLPLSKSNPHIPANKHTHSYSLTHISRLHMRKSEHMRCSNL